MNKKNNPKRFNYLASVILNMHATKQPPSKTVSIIKLLTREKMTANAADLHSALMK